MPLQLRRGVEADRSGITPAVGEPLYVTDTNRLYIGDGTTVGGVLAGGAIDSAAIIGLIDSAYVQARQVDIYRDSAFVTDIVTSAYIQSNQDYSYSSLTGVPTNVSSFTNDAGYTTFDSSNASGLITAAINNLVDAAPTALDTLNELAAALGDDANFATTVTNAIAALPDSSEVIAIATTLVDSAYVQLRQTQQDFAYSSLTGAPTNVSSFANDANYLDSNTVTGVIDATYVTGLIDTTYLDSAEAIALVDSAYVQLRQDYAYSSLTGAPTNVSSFTNDAGYTTFDSANASGLITAAINNLVDAAPSALDTLNELAAALGDDANFATTVTNAIAALPDSAEVATIVTSYGYATQTYVDNAVEALPDSSQVLSLATALVDSAYVQLRQTQQDFAYSSLTGAPNVLDSADVTALIAANSASVVVSGTAPSSPAEGDLWYDNVTTGQLYTYVGTSWLSTAGLTTLEFSSIADLSDVDSATPTNGQYLAWDSASAKYIPTTLAAGTDSATVAAIVTSTVDSSYVQARQDFAYASLTGAPQSGVDFDPVGTDNSTDVTLAGSYNYLTLSGQQITLGQVDASTDITGLATVATTGAYSDLSGTPTTVSTFTNDANYIATNDSAALSSLTTTGNVVVGGNLQVNGSTVTVNSTNLNVTDNMVYMNAGESSGSPTASIDVGWAANVNDQGSYYHVGLFRDATDETFKVYHQYTPEPDDAVQINTGHASFALAPFAASTLTGKYLGFDSDVTAASLATQSYVTSTIDSAYINARVSATDSAAVISIITSTVDSAYVNALVTAGATVSVSGTAPSSPSEGDLWYDNVTTGQLYTYVGTSWLSTAGLTTLEYSSIADLSDVDSSAPTNGQYLAWDSANAKYVPTTLAAGTDSATVAAIVTSTVDSSYVQARQTAQDFAYSSLTGAPTNVSSFTNDAGYLTTAIDSTGVAAIVTSYGYTTFDSTAASSLITTAINNLVDAAPTALDTLNELAAALGDDANFATTVTNAIAALPDSAEVATIITSYGYTTYDSSNTIGLIDSAYIQLRQTQQDFAYSSLTGAPTNVSSFTNDAGYLTIALDSANVIALIDSAYIDARVTASGGALVTVSGTPPASPTEGSLWWDDSSTGQLYIYENSSWTLASPTDTGIGVDSGDVVGIITSYGYTVYDSANTIGLVDSAYVQLRQSQQDFAYSSLTGAPTNVSSFTNDAGYLTTALDSAGVATVIGQSSLADLFNVDSTAPTHGQALVWDSDLSMWKPGTVSGGGGVTTPAVTGSTSVSELSTATYTITNYDQYVSYVVTVSGGTYTRSAGSIYWTFPSVDSDTTHYLTLLAASGGATSTLQTVSVTVQNVTVADTAIIVGDFSATTFNGWY